MLSLSKSELINAFSFTAIFFSTILNISAALHNKNDDKLMLIDLSKPPIHKPSHNVSMAAIARQVTLGTCIGLINREDSTLDIGNAYSIASKFDRSWLETLEGVPVSDQTFMDERVFLDLCFYKVGQGYITWDSTLQQEILPNIITLAAMLDAIPLDVSSQSHHITPEKKLLFDAAEDWHEWSPHKATQYLYSSPLFNTTTGMSKMNPGYNVHGKHKLNPPLNEFPNVLLTDFIVQRRLFTFFLYDNCIRGTPDYALMQKLVTNNNHWGQQPYPVFGYEDSWAISGDLFEAETNCLEEHNLGQIASNSINNLPFFSRPKDLLETPIMQNSDPVLPSEGYDKEKTYVMLIIGDGDNISMMKKRNLIWFTQRLQWCSDSLVTGTEKLGCFPLVWTISPQMLKLMPKMLTYYFEGARETKADYFILPPSGDLYSYPSMMKGDVKKAYVERVEADCVALDTVATVHWEWFYSWKHAFDSYFPLFSPNSIVRGFFLTNVPFPLPMLDIFKPSEEYKILSPSNTVIFKPNEWRGVHGANHQSPSPSKMAQRINDMMLGSILPVYVTSDGGLDLKHVYDMVGMLGSHVVVVNSNVMIGLALEKGV